MCVLSYNHSHSYAIEDSFVPPQYRDVSPSQYMDESQPRRCVESDHSTLRADTPDMALAPGGAADAHPVAAAIWVAKCGATGRAVCIGARELGRRGSRASRAAGREHRGL